SLPPLSDPNYVFPAGNSFAADNLPGNPASVYATVWTGDTYLASDATLDFAGVDVSGGKLLARLALQLVGSAPSGWRSGVACGANPVYQSEPGYATPATPPGGEIVAARPASPIPSPAGLVLVASGAASLLFGRRWRRRGAASC